MSSTIYIVAAFIGVGLLAFLSRRMHNDVAPQEEQPAPEATREPDAWLEAPDGDGRSINIPFLPWREAIHDKTKLTFNVRKACATKAGAGIFGALLTYTVLGAMIGWTQGVTIVMALLLGAILGGIALKNMQDKGLDMISGVTYEEYAQRKRFMRYVKQQTMPPNAAEMGAYAEYVHKMNVLSNSISLVQTAPFFISSFLIGGQIYAKGHKVFAWIIGLAVFGMACMFVRSALFGKQLAKVDKLLREQKVKS